MSIDFGVGQAEHRLHGRDQRIDHLRDEAPAKNSVVTAMNGRTRLLFSFVIHYSPVTPDGMISFSTAGFCAVRARTGPARRALDNDDQGDDVCRKAAFELAHALT